MQTIHSAATAKAATRHAELVKTGAKVVSRAEAAERKLAETEADERKHAERLAAAEEAYADQPTAENVNAIGKAREALDLAKLRVRKPRAEHEAAQAELAAWQAEHDAAAVDAKRTRLHERCSVEAFRAATADAGKRLVAAVEAMHAAATEIDSAFAEANSAARELGEPDLANFHLLAPLLERAAARNGAGGLLTSGGFYRAAQPCAHGLRNALTLSTLETLKLFAANAGQIPENEAAPLFARVLACRTTAEADALAKVAEQEREKERQRLAREELEQSRNDFQQKQKALDPEQTEVVIEKAKQRAARTASP